MTKNDSPANSKKYKRPRSQIKHTLIGLFKLEPCMFSLLCLDVSFHTMTQSSRWKSSRSQSRSWWRSHSTLFSSALFCINPVLNAIKILHCRLQNSKHYYIINLHTGIFIMPPFEKGGAYCFAPVCRYVGMYVGMSVALNLVQLITQ